MSWQPIETAPKDGTEILLAAYRLKYPEIYVGFWGSRRFEGIAPGVGCGCCAGEDPEYTHWMPLPEPPEGV